MPRQHLSLLLLLLTLIVPLTGQAVTLGAARVNSFLGQPLDAEIALIGLNQGQHEDLRLRIANQDVFARLGISYDAILANMRFDVVRSGDRWLVRMRTGRPVIEPFLDFPVQMTWPGGQLTRQYTLLLDPPGRIDKVRVTGRAAPAPAPAAQRPKPKPAADGDYGPVQRGETLGLIAQRLKPTGITTRQMAIALLQANPHAFIDGNINLLRAGARLAIPPRSIIEQTDRATAHAEFAAQTTSRVQAAPQVATSPRTPLTGVAQPSVADSDQSDANQPIDKGTDENADPSDARLQIATNKNALDPASTSERDLQEQLLLTMEEIESNRQTTGAVRERLDQLEAELGRMHELVQLKNAQIEALQSEVSPRAAEDQSAQTTGSVALRPSERESTMAGGKTAVSANKPASAPAELAQIETTALPTASATATGQPWYETYLWAIWAALALLGITALLLFFRRPQAAPDGPLAELPEIQPSAPYDDAVRRQTASLSGVQRDTPSPIDDSPAAPQQPQARDTGQSGSARDSDIDDDISETLLNDMLEESKLLTDAPQRTDADRKADDADIASWIKELGTGTEQAGSTAHKDAPQSDDVDIPSILTELDDQLTSATPSGTPAGTGVQLDPIDDGNEDETFTMSLDLARAYLEIGDQEGARDMLEQALSVAKNPDHRKQIEELLQQID